MKTAFKLAIKSFKNNIGRTFFSLLGIVIGVASVILIMSLGNGMKEFVLDEVRAFGSDIIEIEISIPKTKHSSGANASGIAGASKVTTFKLDEAEKISNLENVQDWYAGNLGQATFSYKNENKNAMIFGVTEGIKDVDQQFNLIEGRMFTENEDKGLNKVVILGSQIKEDLFLNQNPIGEDLKVDGKSYKVIGVLDERGSAGGFIDFDSMVYMPARTMQKRISGIDYIQFAFFSVKDSSKIDETVVQMNFLMRDFHDIEDPEDDDFVVASLAEAEEIIEDVFLIINILLLVLTSISLVVGGVGITNVMYVAVAERTSEIGLRKALGARNSDILKQFLIESILLTLAGGIIGILLGAVLSYIAEQIMNVYNYDIKFILTAPVVSIGFGFSSAVGLIFGLKPAQKASTLSPMEAIRK